MLTMFECLFGGVSWDIIMEHMDAEASGWFGLAFCLYIAIGVMAILNLVTSIFVDNVIKTAMEHKDNLLAMRISEAFLDGGDATEGITCDIFTERMEAQAMQDYFRAIGMHASEAPLLFQLLDLDGSGSVDAEEIVIGCLALRGTAKCIDVCVLLREVAHVQDMMEELLESVKRRRCDYPPADRMSLDSCVIPAHSVDLNL